MKEPHFMHESNTYAILDGVPRNENDWMRDVHERFIPNIDSSGECWLWTSATNDDGYGLIRVGGKEVLAHRFAWNIVHGPIPVDRLVLHTCAKRGEGNRNRACVRIAHLYLGTPAQNLSDAVQSGRVAKETIDRWRNRR